MKKRKQQKRTDMLVRVLLAGLVSATAFGVGLMMGSLIKDRAITQQVAQSVQKNQPERESVRPSKRLRAPKILKIEVLDE